MKIGAMELLLIMIVALMVIGPDKLPQVMRQFGKGLAQFKAATDEATKDIKESIVEPLEEAQKPLKEALEPLNEMDKAVKGNMKDLTDSINSIGKPAKKTTPKKPTLEEQLAETQAQLAALQAQMEAQKASGNSETAEIAGTEAAEPAAAADKNSEVGVTAAVPEMTEPAAEAVSPAEEKTENSDEAAGNAESENV